MDEMTKIAVRGRIRRLLAWGHHKLSPAQRGKSKKLADQIVSDSAHHTHAATYGDKAEYTKAHKAVNKYKEKAYGEHGLTEHQKAMADRFMPKSPRESASRTRAARDAMYKDNSKRPKAPADKYKDGPVKRFAKRAALPVALGGGGLIAGDRLTRPKDAAAQDLDYYYDAGGNYGY